MLDIRNTNDLMIIIMTVILTLNNYYMFITTTRRFFYDLQKLKNNNYCVFEYNIHVLIKTVLR